MSNEDHLHEFRDKVVTVNNITRCKKCSKDLTKQQIHNPTNIQRQLDSCEVVKLDKKPESKLAKKIKI